MKDGMLFNILAINCELATVMLACLPGYLMYCCWQPQLNHPGYSVIQYISVSLYGLYNCKYVNYELQHMYVLNFMHFSSSERHVAHHNRVWKDVSETKRNMRYPGILSWKISYLKFLLMDEK